MADKFQVRALVESHFNRDDARFMATCRQIIASDTAAGRLELPKMLNSLLSKSEVSILKIVPELERFSQVYKPQENLDSLVVSPYLMETLKSVLQEHQRASELGAHGFKPTRKLLLNGPPGTGKTLTAYAMAGQLGLPLVYTRLDSILGSHLGETSASLRKIFNAMLKIEAVFFFDEFDSLGSARGNIHDVGEMGRTVNSLLQMIEQEPSGNLILFASNYASKLDRAFFRRFDLEVEYEYPTDDAIKDLILLNTRKIPLSIGPESYLDQARGLSQAEIVQAIHMAARRSILKGESTVSDNLFRESLQQRHNLLKLKTPPVE